MKFFLRILALLAVLVGLQACGKSQSVGLSESLPLAPGADCVFGGEQVVSGNDANNNSQLEPAEIASSEFECFATLSAFTGIVYREVVDNDSASFWWSSLDGQAKRQLPIPTSHQVIGISLSPDKSHLAIKFRETDEYPWQLMVVPLLNLGAAVTVSGAIVEDGNVSGFAWSPQSDYVAFTGDLDIDGKVELFVSDLSGNRLQVHGEFASDRDVSSFAWSPTANRLAYLLDDQVNNQYRLHTVTAVGSNHQIVTEEVVEDGDVSTHYAWSPDGTYLAFIGDMEIDGVDQLYSAYFDGSGLQTVSDNLFAFEGVTEFYWAPDSSRLVYLESDTNSGITSAHTVLPNGDEATLVSGFMSFDRKVSSIKWSPSGNELAFIADKDELEEQQLYRVAANSDAPVLTSPAMAEGGDILDFFWHPNSEDILVYGDITVDEQVELFVTNLGFWQSTEFMGLPFTSVSETQWSGEGVGAFTADAEINEVPYLYLLNLNDSIAIDNITVPIHATAITWGHSWQPQGNLLAFLVDDSAPGLTDLWIYDSITDESFNLSQAATKGASVDYYIW
mgnify:CR=1 FL=1